MSEAPTADTRPVFTAQVLSILPEMFPGPLGLSLAGRALDRGIWGLKTLDIRDFSRDKHRSVDDTPAGGGPGMVMRADIVADAIDAARADADPDWPLVYLSPRGRRFDQAMAGDWAARGGVTLLCGRFEGVDQRVLDARGVEEVSVGDFVLSGGEPAAIVMLDAVIRLLPGVMGKAESAEEESFSAGLLEAPHYTRPTVWDGRAIPDVLLSGHHGRIAAWRQDRAEEITRLRRPDLWSTYERTANEEG
ncbi:tRNA (guanine37-N(1)-) methyltransferase [Rhodothalassium salexigens DSM 2132]|uniref:tRNA (guanine-N(1)-)-methyltransferase n=1 Tax=Rhodothalassium salexigens DSM 2132 TaxID=1188247 RepID=A0A4V2SPR0_RHOSA|nr:tRNA (guanosine(37)-N1)-methyltransferase TrmD [Rhodothalassium salexigens]MBB4211219.1 tRNA (guanine37-N1)-methyltransferase [Rhodothalassium salexigens DSM 2132]MBK1637558.1 tRNA (guanosine(37)-N1)-methyltransferase TrmD [Rhodothalassium salexigens DSM 2132]TCP36126.1 tRNA (guanine37-N(1)-) methyltransferase [Rhodothalassium salexigens DSM 2132]